MADDRIRRYLEAAAMREGRRDLDLPLSPPNDLARLGAALR